MKWVSWKSGEQWHEELVTDTEVERFRGVF